MPANAAIYFEPEGYSMSGPRLMGRNAAGFGFLNGFFRHADVDRFVGVSATPHHENAFCAMAANASARPPASLITPHDGRTLTELGCFFIPGPGLGEPAWQRTLINRRAYSLCGITHTILTDRVMDSLCTLFTDPLEDWDAIICTSTVARDTITTVLEAEADRLKQRLGATQFPKPQFPIIPLGVDCEKFTVSPDRKAKARQRLGFRDDEIIVLFVGRLSFHAKAHPLPMYQALAEAAQGASIRLVEYGKFFNTHIRDSFDELWSKFAPGLSRTVIDGGSFEAGDDAWAAADIFCSLSDNFQETFGLTPVEAMAAGLPVIVSHWNGYRDTVRDQIDGFRIPTFMPSPGFGQEMITRYARHQDTYDLYCGTTSMAVAIDVQKTITSFRALIHNADLRKKMGEAGRARAQSNFDWRHIIRRYQDLWHMLAERRSVHTSTPDTKYPWPARLNPFYAFQTYATQHLTRNTKLLRRDALKNSDLDQIMTLQSMTLASKFLPPREKFKNFINQFTPGNALSLVEIDSPEGLTEEEKIACIAVGLKIGALFPAAGLPESV